MFVNNMMNIKIFHNILAMELGKINKLKDSSLPHPQFNLNFLQIKDSYKYIKRLELEVILR